MSLTIEPGTYVPTRPGWQDRIVTAVTDKSVTFHMAEQPDRTIAVEPADFGVWVYIAQAKRS